MKIYLLLIFTLVVLNVKAQDHQHTQNEDHTSAYAGEENREIKSLSQDDIEQLKGGKGWGLAKAAELNGVPGPSHVLDMSEEIGLSADQRSKIEVVFAGMQTKAIHTGTKMIEKEKELNQAFASGQIQPSKLKLLTSELGELRGELTFIHLEAHLQTAEILTQEQIVTYNKLRGYDSINPCAEVPEGHNPEMWKQHNNCGD